MSTHPRRASMTPTRMVSALAATMLLAAMATIAPAAADTGPPDEQGYWWRSPALTADQSVPDGGLVVAGQPEGPLAVSALRFTVPADTRAASIHLTVDTDTREAFVEEPLLWACPPDNDWEPAEDGAWEDAPGEHCSPGSSAEGELGEEENEYVFVVSQFIQNGEIDVMITPGVRGAVPSPLLMQELNNQLIEQIGTGAPWPGPPTSLPGQSEGVDGSNFRVTFAPPDGDTLRTGSDSADESVTSLEFEGSGEFDNDFDDSGGQSGGGFDSGGSSDGGSTATPPDTSGSPSSPSPPSTGGGDTPQPETAQPPQNTDGPGEQPVQGSPPDSSGSEPPVALDESQAQGMGEAQPAGSSPMTDPRWLGALVLALGAVAAGMLAMNSQRSELGGLAQFARPRSGPPIRL